MGVYKKSVATPQVWFHVVPRNHVIEHEMSNMLLHGEYIIYIYIYTFLFLDIGMGL